MSQTFATGLSSDSPQASNICLLVFELGALRVFFGRLISRVVSRLAMTEPAKIVLGLRVKRFRTKFFGLSFPASSSLR